MPDGSHSVSGIQDYISNISLKSTKHQQQFLLFILHQNKLIKDGYRLELQTPKTMKLFDSTKKLIDKTKNGEYWPSLKVVEAVLVQCNLVDN